MSEQSRAIVTRLENLQPHPNADLLLVGHFDGMPFLVNKNDSKEGDLRIVVPFDVIPPNEEWVPEFTRGKRVRPIKLRGVFSMCVCLPLPEGDFAIGEDVTGRLGFAKWEPPELRDDGVALQDTYNGKECRGPSGLFLSKYDLESIRKYHDSFLSHEEVYITAKLHGENFTCVYLHDKFWVKSRNRWIEDGDNKWWNTFRKYDFSFLKKHPGICLIGEKYGNVPKFRYDCLDGEQRLRIFDVYDAKEGRFFSVDEFLQFTNDNSITTVPLLYRGEWQGIEAYKDLTEGKAILGGDIEEGYVCWRVNPNLPRLKLKWHSEKFLLKKN